MLMMKVAAARVAEWTYAHANESRSEALQMAYSDETKAAESPKG
jgi:hypothetical protein